MSVPLLLLAGVLASAAVQQPAPRPSSGPAAVQPAAVPAKVSIDGCVVTGKEVGRKADLREKTGLDEHFVLSSAKIVKGRAPSAGAAGAGTPALSMFKISGLTDEQLKIHVGHRVRVEGSFGSLEDPDAPADTAPQDNLVELNVATIRQVPGDCAVVPKS